VDLEVQVADEKNYRERALYYLARDYSSALGEGENYSKLPNVAVISILDYNLFKNTLDFRSEYGMLELSTHQPLSDHFKLLFFELPKLPKTLNPNDPLGLWLAIFRAKKRVDLERIDALEVPIMQDAIKAYHRVVNSKHFKEVERLRREAKSNETSALDHARRVERAKVLREMRPLKKESAQIKAESARKDKVIARLKAELTQRPK
jgi:predicted transposase/invertase (TIGR01784 family)